MTQRASLQTDKQLYPSISAAVHSSGSFSPVRLCASEGPTDSFPHMWRFCNNSWWQLFNPYRFLCLYKLRFCSSAKYTCPCYFLWCCSRIIAKLLSSTANKCGLNYRAAVAAREVAGEIDSQRNLGKWCFGWRTDQRRFFRPLFCSRKYILRFSRCDERLSHQQDKITCQIPVAV